MTSALRLVPNTAPSDAQYDPTILAVKVEEAARRLSIGRTTMFALIRDGAVPTVRIGHLRRVPVQALNDYLNAQMQTPGQSSAA
jgi:excisionase family DNA binding protein